MAIRNLRKHVFRSLNKTKNAANLDMIYLCVFFGSAITSLKIMANELSASDNFPNNPSFDS